MATIHRKIEKSAEATLNIGEMQFLKIRSSISEDVEAENEQELNEANSKIWEDLSIDIRKGMWKMIKILGKTTDADKRFFEACESRVQAATKPAQTAQTEEKINEQK